jgi:hypothetical protein
MIPCNEVGEASKTVARGTGNSTPRDRIGLGCHFLGKRQLAFSLGVSARTVDTWISEKRIPFLRLSPRLIRFELNRVLTALGRYEVHEIGRGRSGENTPSSAFVRGQK